MSLDNLALEVLDTKRGVEGGPNGLQIWLECGRLNGRKIVVILIIREYYLNISISQTAQNSFTTNVYKYSPFSGPCSQLRMRQTPLELKRTVTSVGEQSDGSFWILFSLPNKPSAEMVIQCTFLPMQTAPSVVFIDFKGWLTGPLHEPGQSCCLSAPCCNATWNWPVLHGLVFCVSSHHVVTPVCALRFVYSLMCHAVCVLRYILWPCVSKLRGDKQQVLKKSDQGAAHLPVVGHVPRVWDSVSLVVGGHLCLAPSYHPFCHDQCSYRNLFVHRIS